MPRPSEGDEMHNEYRKEDYQEVIRLICAVQEAADIRFSGDEAQENIFKSREDLIHALYVQQDIFEEKLTLLLRNTLFMSISKNYAFQSFKKKAVRFWKVEEPELIKSRDFFNRKVSRWVERENIVFPPLEKVSFEINFSFYRIFDGMNLSDALSVIKAIAEIKAEPTITASEAKKAAAYVEKHQEELFKQQEIVMRYAKQQGMVEPTNQWGTRGHSRFLMMRATISPDLLELVQKDAKNIRGLEARRIIAPIIRGNSFIAKNPPISALTELTSLVGDDFISPDTVSRYVKVVNDYPRGYRGLYFINRKKLL